RGDDAVEGRSIHDQVFYNRKRRGTPRLEVELVAILKVAHVQLANGGAFEAAVGLAIDHEAAHAADPFATIVVKRDGILAFLDQPLVQHIQHLEERHVLVHARNLVANHAPAVLRVFLPPDVKYQFHLTCSSAARASRNGRPKAPCSAKPGGARPGIPTRPRKNNWHRRAKPRPRASGTPRGN